VGISPEISGWGVEIRQGKRKRGKRKKEEEKDKVRKYKRRKRYSMYSK
jgi:hypothetical protein